MEQEPLWPNDMENELSNDYFNRSHGSFDGMFSSPTHERRLNDSRNNSRGSQGDEPGKGVADPPVAPHSTTAEAEWMKIFGGHVCPNTLNTLHLLRLCLSEEMMM